MGGDFYSEVDLGVVVGGLEVFASPIKPLYP